MDEESTKVYDPMLLGVKVLELRNERGWTQKQLADKLGISDNSVSDIENGKNKVSGFEMVEKLLDVFNITYDILFENVLIALKAKSESEIDKRVEHELKAMGKEKLFLANDTLKYFLEHENKRNEQ